MHQDELYIKRCLELAQRGKANAAPNPMVGAVLVHDGRIIGEGWHDKYGEAHAEVNCLASVKDEDSHLVPESTMYVSLEPCTHYGKTPPCAKRLVEENVKKVVVGNIDPFHKVQGGGIDILKNGGVEVSTGVLSSIGSWVNRRFFCFHEKQRPYIILKWAESANGYFAPLDRSRLQMTGKLSKQLVHKWRTEESAIMVGYHTALNDNPALTARDWKGSNPLRIVLDKELKLPESHNLFDSSAGTWVVNSLSEGIRGSIQYLKTDFNEPVIPQILNKMHIEQKTSLFVEGGTALLQSFIDAGLWDEARVFTSGDKLLDNGIGTPQLSDSKLQFTTKVGADTLRFFTNKNSAYKYQPGWEL